MKRAVRRGDVPGTVVREARRTLAKSVRELELKQHEEAAEASAEELGLVVPKTKIWTPEEGSK